MKSVSYGRTLRKELRIGSDFHPNILLYRLFQPLLQLIVCSNRNGRLDNNHTVSSDTLSDLIHHLIYIAQIRGSILFLRSTYSYKDYFRVLIGRSVIGCKSQSFHIFMHQIFQPRFINGGNTLTHGFNLLRIYVHTGYMVSSVRQSHPCHQSNISCSCYCYFHYLHLSVPGDGISFVFLIKNIAQGYHRVNFFELFLYRKRSNVIPLHTFPTLTRSLRPCHSIYTLPACRRK